MPNNSKSGAVKNFCSPLRRYRFILLLSLAAAVFAVVQGRPQIREASTESNRFGTIRTFLGSDNPQRGFMIFASAADWIGPAAETARGLAAAGNLVIGVDETAYRKQMIDDDDDCLYIAGEIQRLSQSVQSGLKLPRYLYPILVGYGDGAALAFITLAQHPEPVFGGILIDFRQTYPSPKDFCQGDFLAAARTDPETIRLAPTAELPVTAVGIDGPDCSIESIEDLLSETAPQPGAGYFDTSAVPACGRALYAAIQAVQPDSDLPENSLGKVSAAEGALVELFPEKAKSDFFVLFVSGDGGWATIDKKLGEFLQLHDVPVVGFDSLDYFWKLKTPEQTGRDMTAIIERYLKEFKMDRFAIAGFSMGADIVPFVLDELPTKLRRKLTGVALLSPSRTASFEVHISDWIGIEESSDFKPILPKLKELGPLRIACFYGEDEAEDSLCTTGTPLLDKVVKFPGGHHFDEHYDELAGDLLEFLSSGPPNQPPLPGD